VPIVLLTALAVFAAEPTVYTSDVRLERAPQLYRDDDRITSVHETTHWANSELRGRYGGGAFYVGGGKFFWVASAPKTPTLGQFARMIRFRGRLAAQYLEASRYPLTPQWRGSFYLEGHEHNPLFLFDEQAAYINGAEVAVRYTGQRWADRVASALEMSHYAHEVYRYMPTSYRHRSELGRIWLAQARRIEAIAETSRRTGRQYSAASEPWRAQLRRDLAGFR
jgi:hypothetical protein